MTGKEEFLERVLRTVLEDAEESLDIDNLDFVVIVSGTIVGSNQKGELIRTSVSYYPFDKGEIVVMPRLDTGSSRWPEHRDILTGRSCFKYDVGTERFGKDWDAAKRRSNTVKAAPDKDMFE